METLKIAYHTKGINTWKSTKYDSETQCSKVGEHEGTTCHIPALATWVRPRSWSLWKRNHPYSAPAPQQDSLWRRFYSATGTSSHPLFQAQGTIRKGSKGKANNIKKKQGNSNHPNSRPGAKLLAMWPSVSAAGEGLAPHSGSSPPRAPLDCRQQGPRAGAPCQRSREWTQLPALSPVSLATLGKLLHVFESLFAHQRKEDQSQLPHGGVVTTTWATVPGRAWEWAGRRHRIAFRMNPLLAPALNMQIFAPPLIFFILFESPKTVRPFTQTSQKPWNSAAQSSFLVNNTACKTILQQELSGVSKMKTL